MRSMTGYGRSSIMEPGFSVSIEIKTVNNRFLDINLRLPGELQGMENNFRRQIAERLSRGRADVSIQYNREEEIIYELNRPLISGYLSALGQLQEEFSLAGEPDLNVIARLPNVLVAKRDEPSAEIINGTSSALQTALDDLERMRALEGELLKTELEARLREIENRLPAIEAEAAGITEEIQLRLDKRINEMLARCATQIEIDQGRLAQEVAFLADRSDISEEITRLKAHIGHFRTIMAEENEVGKRLDFLTQELNREANTIASKTGNLTIKENALQIKSEIEKIREQVQNVE